MDTERLYKYANKIAGTNGADLLHHCLANFDTSKAKDFYSYMYGVMRNQYIDKKSSFNKLFLRQEIPDFNIDSIDSYDINILHTILHELEIQGYKNEVSLFKECKFVSSVYQVSLKRKIPRARLTKICKFIIDEIHRTYPKL